MNENLDGLIGEGTPTRFDCIEPKEISNPSARQNIESIKEVATTPTEGILDPSRHSIIRSKDFIGPLRERELKTSREKEGGHREGVLCVRDSGVKREH